MMSRIGWAVIFVSVFAAGIASAADIAHLRNGFTIRHESRQAVGDSIRLFLTNDRTSFVDIPSAEIIGYEHDESVFVTPSPPGLATAASAAKPAVQTLVLNDVIQSASDRYRLDPDLVNSVIRAESGFNPNAVSYKGAQGLMQLMPKTAGQLGVSNRLDPQQNVEGGARYLRELLERYNFDLLKALAAYNAGPGRVEQYGGVPPYRETRAYVTKIVRDFNKKKIAQRHANGKSATQATPVAGKQ